MDLISFIKVRPSARLRLRWDFRFTKFSFSYPFFLPVSSLRLFYLLILELLTDPYEILFFIIYSFYFYESITIFCVNCCFYQLYDYKSVELRVWLRVRFDPVHLFSFLYIPDLLYWLFQLEDIYIDWKVGLIHLMWKKSSCTPLDFYL